MGKGRKKVVKEVRHGRWSKEVSELIYYLAWILGHPDLVLELFSIARKYMKTRVSLMAFLAIVYMHFIKGIPMHDVARVLDLTYYTVHKVVYATKFALRKEGRRLYEIALEREKAKREGGEKRRGEKPEELILDLLGLE